MYVQTYDKPSYNQKIVQIISSKSLKGTMALYNMNHRNLMLDRD